MNPTPSITAPVDLSVPIRTIEHLAAALHLSVDSAREYTYRHDFPAAKAGFARNLWEREEVLAWFAALPPAVRHRAPTTTAGLAAAATPKAAPAASAAPASLPASG